MVIGACKITIRISSVSSLKGKRQIVKKIVERVKNKFNSSIAEVGSHDKWQKAEIGFCVVGNEGSFVNSVLDKILDYIEDMQLAENIHSEIEIIHL
ncbi:MAG: DUF503 domain-containing protein [Proteobacteria bacterium]|nr:DUF503 domain-containing protein [Pseudomonadota bacterium]